MSYTANHLLKVFPALIIGLCPFIVQGQFTADLTSTENTNCSGTQCDYDGPSILINELMMTPLSGDGSLWGGSFNQAGEWIELYNPNICEPIDISCYYLGNNANDNSPYPGGYVIPPGTVVPPAGFALIRGVNAAPVPSALLVENGGNVVELVVTGEGVCVGGGSRLWFPNAGGWFAFYDNNGVPQDAVSWANQSNIDKVPCVPVLGGCNFSGPLASYNDFPNDRKEYILNQSSANFQGSSHRRIPDGGAWGSPGSPTYATCNSGCVDVDFSVCNGTATATPQGGVAPYTFLWDDVQNQTTQTAEQLCAGEYCVTIIDALNDTIQQCVIVVDASYEQHITDGFCEGDTYTLPDNSTVTEAGEYTLMFQTAGDCDSLITVELEMYPVYHYDLTAEICANDVYTLPDGTEVSETGIYEQTFQTIHGCDSTYTVDLTVIPGINVPVSAEICHGSSYVLPDGTEVDEAGLYEVLISGSPACDTLYVVDVQVYDPIQIDTDLYENISCSGQADGTISLSVSGGTAPYTYAWSDGVDHGSEATGLDAGTYTVLVSDENNCENEATFEISEPLSVALTAISDTLICFGTELNLTALATGGTGDFEYHWSHTTSTNATSNVTPEDDATYTVSATDENGCTTETITINVSVITMQSELLETLPGTPVCQGEETTVEAFYNGDHPPYHYTWSHGLPDGPGPHVVSPEETTSYTVTVSDDCGNSVSAEMEIIIRSLPVAEVLSNDVSCNGLEDGSAEIVVTGGTPDYNYVWSNGNATSSAENLAPGSYYVFVFDAFQCANIAAVTIAEPAVVELQANADTLICLGTSAELNATATGGTENFTYHWNENLTDQSSHLVSPENTTAYSVYASDENGCQSETIEMTVEVITMEADLLTITPGDPVCSGGSSEVVASYDGAHPPYSYVWSNGLPDGPGPHSVSPDETANYSVTVSDLCGNSVTGTTTIEIYPNPEPILGEVSEVICHGESNGTATVLVNSGTPEFTFHWSGSDSQQAIATNLAAGPHSVIVVDANQCTDSLEFQINEPEPLDISVTADTLVCIGTMAEISATSTGGVGTYTYHWSHNLPSNANQQVEMNANTIFDVYASDANGCVTAPESIGVNVISMSANLLDVMSGPGVCSGETTTVAAQYNGDHPPYTYQWSHNLPNGAGPHSVNPGESTNYTVTVNDHCGNEVEKEVPVTIYPLPVVDLPSMMAEGCEDLSVMYTDSLNDSSTHSWVWTIDDDQIFNGQTLNYVFAEPGMHTVDLSVVSFQGCQAETTAPSLVMVFPSPVADFSANPWETGIDDAEVHFTDLSTGDIISWNWNFADGSSAVIQNPTHTYGDTGTYYVQLIVENEYECISRIEKPVRIYPYYNVVIPNAFTPTSNNNGYYDPNNPDNDIFYVFADYVEEFRMSIFNRWGELIFESTDFQRGWNGWYRDEPCPQDVYVYKVEFTFSDGVKETRVGNVTLFR